MNIIDVLNADLDDFALLRNMSESERNLISMFILYHDRAQNGRNEKNRRPKEKLEQLDVFDDWNDDDREILFHDPSS